MRHFSGLCIPLALICAMPSVAMAQDADQVRERASDVVSALQGKLPLSQVFGADFLAAVPEPQVRALIASLEAENGKLTGVDEIKPGSTGTATMLLRFEKANANAVLRLEAGAPHKVAGFRISAVTLRDDTAPKLIEAFNALPGRSGFALYRLGKDEPQSILTHRSTEQFAIGSAFKLWVLDAVADDVKNGRMRWDMVGQLTQPRSYPSGILQDWPDGTSVTVETLATLMISMSDNTATDALMGLIGQDSLAASLRGSGHSEPSGMTPMLTTLEAFTIKNRGAALARRYAAADDKGQQAILNELRAGLRSPKESEVDVLAGTTAPRSIDSVEWFASSRDVAGILDRLRRREDPKVRAILATGVRLPPDRRAAISYAGYKGGSEPGVINLSYLLQSRSGDWLVATASWNNPDAPVDNTRFELLVMRLLAMVR